MSKYDGLTILTEKNVEILREQCIADRNKDLYPVTLLINSFTTITDIISQHLPMVGSQLKGVVNDINSNFSSSVINNIIPHDVLTGNGQLGSYISKAMTINNILDNGNTDTLIEKEFDKLFNYNPISIVTAKNEYIDEVVKLRELMNDLRKFFYIKTYINNGVFTNNVINKGFISGDGNQLQNFISICNQDEIKSGFYGYNGYGRTSLNNNTAHVLIVSEVNNIKCALIIKINYDAAHGPNIQQAPYCYHEAERLWVRMETGFSNTPSYIEGTYAALYEETHRFLRELGYDIHMDVYAKVKSVFSKIDILVKDKTVYLNRLAEASFDVALIYNGDGISLSNNNLTYALVDTDGAKSINIIIKTKKDYNESISIFKSKTDEISINCIDALVVIDLLNSLDTLLDQVLA